MIQSEVQIPYVRIYGLPENKVRTGRAPDATGNCRRDARVKPFYTRIASEAASDYDDHVASRFQRPLLPVRNCFGGSLVP